MPDTRHPSGRPAVRIGSVCTGYGGLDDAVQRVFGGELVWVADNDPGAAAILAHHYPNVPNLGDVTAVDWDQVPPIDVLTMGFPCQDVSVAGQRAGLLDGNRSGLWRHCARTISILRPSLVVIENVPGLLSSPADGYVEPCPWCLGDPGDEPPLRALGAVLADLAGLGFDAEWTSLDASAVGACHKRRRVFILAWPAHADRDTVWEQPVAVCGRGSAAVTGLAGEAASDAASLGHGHAGASGKRRVPAAAVASGAAARGSAAAHAANLGLERGGQHGNGGPDLRTAVGTVTAADTDSEPRGERRHAAPGETQGGGASAVDCGCDRASWGRYAPAIHRWEQVTGRAAPAPVDENGRLAPPFVEWMQGLDEGHVTGVPGLSRRAMLKALGNGVVSVQAAAALPLLAARAGVAV